MHFPHQADLSFQGRDPWPLCDMFKRRGHRRQTLRGASDDQPAQSSPAIRGSRRQRRWASPPLGHDIRIDTPLDFAGVTDHSEYVGVVNEANGAPDTGIYAGANVVDADLSKYFDTISHSELIKSVARRVVDRNVLRLIKMWLRAPIEERDADRNPARSRIPFARYKGEAEKALLAAGSPVEPRKEPNFSYRLLRAIYPVFRVLFPNLVIRADDLARAMVEAAIRGTEERGGRVLENRDIRSMVALRV